MLSNRIALAALAMICVAAAAGGGFLATRQTLPATAATPDDATRELVEPAKAVQETESVVTPPTEATPPVEPKAPTPPEPRRSAPRPAQSSQTKSARVSEPPALDRTWPANATPAASQPPAAPVDTSASTAQAPVESRPTFTEPTPAPAPEPIIEELVVSSDSVIGLQLETSISSERARVEDTVEARVVRDVRVGRQVAIPAGARATGSVVVVERGGKFKDRARLGIRFHTLVLADGTRLPISTDTIYRYGDSPGDGSAKKIGGGAVAGAILGAIIGGAKGAAVGATAGAGGGTAMVMSGDRSAAEFPAGTDVTARILSPVTVTVDR